MVTTKTTAMDQDLMQTALRAILDPTTVPGPDGYFVTEGQPVCITADKTIKPCGPGEDADGIATESLFWTQVPGAAGQLLARPDDRTRVSWLPFKYGRKVLRVPIGPGGLQAGNRVAYDPTTMAYVAAQPLGATIEATTTVDATDLEGTIPEGETQVTSTGAQPAVTVAGAVTAATTATATLAGTALPTDEVGICWQGGIETAMGLIIV